jgi:WD40 repeat protein
LTLTVLDADTGKERSITIPIPQELAGQTGSDLREPLTFNPDGSRLAIAVTAQDGLQRRMRWFLVDPRAGGVLAVLDESGFAHKSGASEPVNAFFTPDGKVFGWTAHFGIKRFEETGKPLDTFWGHGNTVAACLPTPDNRRMLSVGQDGDLKEWNLHPPEPKGLSVPGFPYFSTSADGRWIARATMSEVTVVDPAGKTPKTVRLRPRGDYNWVKTALSGDGKRVAVLRPGDEEGTAAPDVSVWDVASDKELLFETIPEKSTVGTFNQLTLSPAGDRVAVVLDCNRGLADRPLRIFDINTGKLHQSKPFPGTVYQLAFSPDGRTVAALTSVRSREGTITRKLVIWDGLTGLELREIDCRPKSRGMESKMAWSPDSTRLAVSGAEDDQVHIHFYDVRTGRVAMVLDRLSRFSAFRVLTIDLAFSRDGRRIAYYVPRPRVVKICDADNGKELLALPVIGEEMMFHDLTFTADSHRLHLVRNMSREILEVKTWDATPRK